MRDLKLLDPRRAGHDAKKLDGPRALRFQDRSGLTRAMPGGKHRIEQEHIRRADVYRQPIIIADRPKRFRVAVKTDMPDARLRRHAQNSIQHSETSPKD